MANTGTTLFGTLSNMAERTARNGTRYAAGTIIITNKAGEEQFRKSIVSFKDTAVAALLAAGNGTRVRVFGYRETVEAEGGKFTRETLKVVDARDLTKKADAPAAEGAAPAADAPTENQVESQTENPEVPF